MQEPMHDLLRGSVGTKAGNDRWEEDRMQKTMNLEDSDGL
jgi:hypothetical protein